MNNILFEIQKELQGKDLHTKATTLQQLLQYIQRELNVTVEIINTAPVEVVE